MKIINKTLAHVTQLCYLYFIKLILKTMKTQDLKSVQEMTQQEFVETFKNASDNELVAENIMKIWSSEEGGYWYVANAGDCDGDDTINYWFGSDADEKGYVEELDARI